MTYIARIKENGVWRRIKNAFEARGRTLSVVQLLRPATREEKMIYVRALRTRRGHIDFLYNKP
jgi:hypothetical protein